MNTACKMCSSGLRMTTKPRQQNFLKKSYEEVPITCTLKLLYSNPKHRLCTICTCTQSTFAHQEVQRETIFIIWTQTGHPQAEFVGTWVEWGAWQHPEWAAPLKPTEQHTRAASRADFQEFLELCKPSQVFRFLSKLLAAAEVVQLPKLISAIVLTCKWVSPKKLKQ